MEEQGKLFEIEPIRLPRPTYNTIDGQSAYENLAKRINEWDSKISIEDAAGDLKKTFSPRHLSINDGYEICKQLEKYCGYHPDFQLSEEMDCCRMYIDNTLQEEIKKWVIKCWIKPKYKIDDIVFIQFKNKTYHGKIIKILENEARYLIEFKEENIVSELLYNYEMIEPDFFDKK